MSSLPPSDKVDPLAKPQLAQAEEGEADSDSMQARQRFLRRSFGRWLLMAPMRLLYRFWTRIAAHLFPEDTSRARLAEQIGVALPDRLDMSWVTDSLAVGGRVREEDIGRLAQSGVTCVIDTRAEYRDDEAALNRAGIQLLYLPTPDTQPLTVEQLMEGSAYASQQMRDGQRVLIHCEHGVGRSVLLTCATLVRDGYSAEAALGLVQAKRWQASPNHRQIKRLHEFEAALQAELPRLV
jgi:protein tyrosine phosphatase (PTP) superfamily phosphohydrolase (DUF442 family)